MTQDYTLIQPDFPTSVHDFSNKQKGELSRFISWRNYLAIKALKEFNLPNHEIAKKLKLPYRQSVEQIIKRWEAK